MNRRAFIAGLASAFTSTALAAVAQPEPDFEVMWRDRAGALALRHVPPTEPFDEDKFNKDIRNRTLVPPPKRKRRWRTRFTRRRRRYHG